MRRREAPVNYDEFVIEVERRMPGRSREEAERTLTAVVAVLAERLDRDSRRRLAAFLPDRLKELFPEKTVTAGYGLEEFLSRIERRANVQGYAPKDLALVVTKVLGLGLPTGELPGILQGLPEAYRQSLIPKPPAKPGRLGKPPVRG